MFFVCFVVDLFPNLQMSFRFKGEVILITTLSIRQNGPAGTLGHDANSLP